MAICEHCGKQYTPKKAHQKFCSDACRKREFADAKLREKREAKRARRNQQPPRRIYDNGISATDPRRQLVQMRAHGLLTREYWALYAEVDIQFNGGRSFVNGIPTTAPYFVDAVLFQIDIDGRIICETQGKKKDDI